MRTGAGRSMLTSPSGGLATSGVRRCRNLPRAAPIGVVVFGNFVILVYFAPSGLDLQVRARFAAEDVAVAFCADRVQYLGTGGFGESWLVETGSHRQVAKVIHNRSCPIDRLTREVEGLIRLDSPRVVRLLDVCGVLLRSDRWPALLFEYVEGGNVHSRLVAGDWPTVSEVIAFATALLDGLEYLHAHDAVHRDLKPENIALRHAGWDEPVILHLLLAHEHPFYDEIPLDERQALQRIHAGPRPLPDHVTAPLRPLVQRRSTRLNSSHVRISYAVFC